MEHNGIQFNLIAGTLTANGKEIELTKTELKIMYYLFKHTGEIVPRIDLVEYLWDNEIHIDDNTLSVNIMRIREKLRILGWLISYRPNAVWGTRYEIFRLYER